MAQQNSLSDEQLNELFQSTALSIWNKDQGPILWDNEDLPAPFALNDNVVEADTELFTRLNEQGLISDQVLAEMDLYFTDRKDWAQRHLFTNIDLFNMAADSEHEKHKLKAFIENDPWDFKTVAGEAYKTLQDNLGAQNNCASASGKKSNPWITSAQATVHCMTGCIIGEAAGLAIGVSLGWSAAATIGLAFGLAYASGFTLGLLPLMKREDMSLKDAFKVIWLGEAVSIFAMEVAMNATDYAVGGMHASSVADPIFWIGMAAAIPAGFAAAWPVNHWLLKKQLKKCHHHDESTTPEDNEGNETEHCSHTPNPPAP